MKFEKILFLFLILGQGGCVTKAAQTKALLMTAALPFSSEAKIENVKFINQATGQCGPATLAMAMSWAGKDVSVSQLSTEVFTPGLKGSLQSDMIGGARRHGMMAIPIQNLSSLLAEVSAGHPVIVFENLSFRWAPQWHYALVTGYDLSKKEIIMHSGPEADKHWDLEKFERSWMLGDYWGLVVLPPGKIAASADEMAHVQAAVSLENLNHLNEAKLSYEKILEKWPTSLLPMIGLANIAFEANDRVTSIKWLRKAVMAHPESRIARYNLQVAESQ